jgi:NADH:ubiquinone oxidoreductase subunit 4 (subunit M)
MDLGGFTLTTFFFLFFSMMLLDSKKRWMLCGLLALVLSGIGYAAFIAFFQTRLPKGPVEWLLAGIS